MIAIRGKYKNGRVVLEKKVDFDNEQNVIVTFLEEESEANNSVKQFDIGQLSIGRSRAILKNIKSSFSDEIVEERRQEL